MLTLISRLLLAMLASMLDEFLILVLRVHELLPYFKVSSCSSYITKNIEAVIILKFP